MTKLEYMIARSAGFAKSKKDRTKKDKQKKQTIKNTTDLKKTYGARRV